MSEQDKQMLGDGQDNYSQAAKSAATLARQAAQGTEAASTAAGLTAQAGMEAGKAAAGIATGTAMAGPLGTALSLAWSLRHTIVRILVCLALVMTVFVVMIVSLPTVVTNSIFGLDGTQPEEEATLTGAYMELAELIAGTVHQGHEDSLAEVERIIANGDYDYELSMEALIDHAQTEAGYDVCYILAAYSASLQQQNVSGTDMERKLLQRSREMFPVTYEEDEILRPVQSESEEDDEGGSEEDADDENADDTEEPEMELIKYVKCTIHPFNTEIIKLSFGLNMNDQYPGFNITYREVIEKMASALKKTLYLPQGGGEMVPLTDEELIAFLESQNLTGVRRDLLANALSLVGKVSYFWGGKSAPGWNDEWGTPKLVTCEGSPSTGTIQPFGMDCSGFSHWVYETTLGVDIGAGTFGQFPNTVGLSAAELLPGDLGFLPKESGSGWNHVLIFAGYGESGQRMWVHCTSGSGVVLNTVSYDSSLYLRRLTMVNYD